MKQIQLIFILILGWVVYALPQDLYLKKNGKTTQLIVGGKPFLIFGGELGNSFTARHSYTLGYEPN